MSLASRIADLTTALAVAVNARSGKVGASAYELAVINGYTGTQAQWLQQYAPAQMTNAQRLALTGTDLWSGRQVTETDTGITYRYVGTTWRAWDSDWLSTSPSWGTGGAPIYLQVARYRYRGGRVLFESQITLNAGGVSGDVWVAVPVAIATPYQNAGVAAGTVKFVNASDGYRPYEGAFTMDPSNQRILLRKNGFVNDATRPGAQDWLQTCPFNEAWAQSDQMFVSIEYDTF